MTLRLADVQALVQQAIIANDDAPAGLVRRPPRDTAETMFGVYCNAYALRLTEFLRNDFEKLRLLMGPDRFDAMARDYIAAHVSDTPNARWYSRHLPQFLGSDPRYCRDRSLRDMAALEQAINDVFDAEDGPRIKLADLAEIDAGHAASACFTVAASVIRLSVMTAVAEAWPCLADESAVPPIGTLEKPAELLVWRQEDSSRFRVLDPEETMAFDSVRSGVPFGVLCEMIAMMDDPENAASRAAGYLRNWIESGLLSAIAIAGQD